MRPRLWRSGRAAWNSARARWRSAQDADPRLGCLHRRVASAAAFVPLAPSSMLGFDEDGLGGLSGLGGGGLGGGGLGGRGSFGAPPAPPKVPVSILTGFLGAGKTTLVGHILRNREGMKVGVVVNDVAEANIDSEVLKFDDADGIVGLQNGCACCSGRDDLFARLEELVNSTGVSKLDRQWDRLVVECSGVAEPESIARELEAMGRRGEPVMRRIFLAGIICVVDASTFWESYHSTESAPDCQPLSVLLVSQLESADTLIINKSDLVSQAEMARLQQLLSALAPNARRIVTTRGALALRELLPADPVTLDMPAYVPTLANRHGTAVRSAGSAGPPVPHAAVAPMEEPHGHGHGHGHSEGHSHGHSHSHEGDSSDCAVCATELAAQRHDRYGLSSFVYRRPDRLFDGARLAMTAQQLPVSSASLAFGAVDDPAAASSVKGAPTPAFTGVLRSKGFVHVKGHESALYWSHAGKRLQVAEAAGSPPPRGPNQELVFIGTGMDQAAIEKALDACLEPDASL
mmetsp:Transcript_140160/g.349300  ORF Transcript_140160/g.349300 Transcript_140160/m.349300 type:complete len:517 (-) Transcript_140160:22-1572(-)